MAQIVLGKVESASAVPLGTFSLHKRITTLGYDSGLDIALQSQGNGVVCTFMKDETDKYEVIPSPRIRLLHNGQVITQKMKLKHCDRLEWEGGCAAFLDSTLPPALGSTGEAHHARWVQVSANLAELLQAGGAGQGLILTQVLDTLVELANAEQGAILTEKGRDGSWHLLMHRLAEDQSPVEQKRKIFSDSILQKALTTKKPVYIESMIGHELSSTASVIEARIFSAACFPLMTQGRVIGALYLSTRSAGRSIQKSSLQEIGILATQTALLLSTLHELEVVRSENFDLKDSKQDPKASIFTFSTPQSPMAEVEKKIVKLAPTDLNILILGETGTGKELTANALHKKSGRAAKPFVAINCAAIPETLLESTLFGYEKGAFTGAIKSQPGKFLAAHGGTLFLDEIGDLSMDLQAKLLRVLQEKIVEPVGSLKGTPIDVRIVCATHKPLDALMKQGKFRQDLYFRLAGATLQLPALRKRKSDIPALAEHFLRKAQASLAGTPVKHFSPEALAFIENYLWPGNIRELEQVITRATLLAEGNEILVQDLDLDQSQRMVSLAPGSSGNDLEEQDFASLDEAQKAFTTSFVQKTLERNEGNRTATSYKLGISERTLYRILSGKNQAV